MTGDSAVLDFRRPFPDRDGIDDLTARLPADISVLRTADAALGPQMSNQLFFQRSPRLDEQATVNGFVGHAHTLVLGILGLQPSGDLFRRPVQHQFNRNDLLQLLMQSKKAGFRPQSRLPGLLIRFTRSIFRTATMTYYFPAHRRRRAVQKLGDLTNRRTRSDPSRDILSFRQCECQQRAATDCRNKPTVQRHHTANGRMTLAERTPNLMQRLSRLPTAPQVALLHRRKPKPFTLPHTTPPLERRSISDGVASTH